jgi:hypothetical protein
MDSRMRVAGLDTHVQKIESWRKSSTDPETFLRIAHKKGDPFRCPQSGKKSNHMDVLRGLIWGAPKIRRILKEIYEYVLPSQDELRNHPDTARIKKLLIAEDSPFVAWLLETILNWLGIPAQVLHAKLSEEDRAKVVRDFNTPPKEHNKGAKDERITSLTVTIILYSVGSQGINLDKDCCRMIVNTPSTNAAVEVQAWGRLIRVSFQEHN